ncbi:helix-turn-helix domain-containing protein [Pseudonocardia sp. ICBG1142]|uniref:winged helix-turn-helix transcriptional regulator n=1 Tax=Pseudonocardia sp. ICBG1142 TaxID=2846760 RepID=UPI001CF6CC30|nr:helix-turn-helix domain-containing protein [Pseudonocardia sp. ICBG1142]
MVTTKAAQRAQAKAEYNAFFATCPSRQLLDRLSNKWVVLVLCALGDEADGGDGPRSRTMRYSELARLLAGVSQKMLPQTLRSLEADGLVTRTVTPTVPVTVEYALTELGGSLLDLTRGLRLWAQDHMDEVLAHRSAVSASTAP